ncbi:F-box protein At5g07610-like [Rhododendron vialii]|uniref:F-box protein At5g07610-like n=1 Tax=Rhododendron vialii TaxID=182163 RepID=UPI00265F773D|nr:F-box protein At5g07610-like [Rhododendron vialii]
MTRNASNKRTKAVLKVTPSDISPAAELIAANIDLLMEILLRLPVKSTIRFKSVSKHWLSLLSDTQFATNHSTRNPRPSSISGLYFNSQETLNFVSLHGCRHNLPSLSFLNGLGERFGTVEVAHSCNGLLLCYKSRMMRIDRHFVHYNIVCIVCNPTTKKYTLLPKRDGVVCGWSVYLVFDPSKSPRHYKVVLVGYSPGPYGPYQIDVYSSESLCWRKVISHQEIFGRGIFWNGAIHWLTCDDFLKRFDIDVEEIITMPNPQSPKILPRNKIMYFGECGGGLILIQSHSYCYCSSGLRILELERDYSSWVVKCQVNLRALISAFPEMESRRNKYCLHGFTVLCAAKGESERGLVLLLAIPGRIVSYNPKKKTWDVLRDLVPRELEALDLNINYAVPYIETLFPV